MCLFVLPFSITIDDVVYVIDCGKVKEKVWTVLSPVHRHFKSPIKTFHSFIHPFIAAVACIISLRLMYLTCIRSPTMFLVRFHVWCPFGSARLLLVKERDVLEGTYSCVLSNFVVLFYVFYACFNHIPRFRVQPGQCFHLFTEYQAQKMIDYQLPEMLRTPLEELCLQIKVTYVTLIDGRDLVQHLLGGKDKCGSGYNGYYFHLLIIRS